MFLPFLIFFKKFFSLLLCESLSSNVCRSRTRMQQLKQSQQLQQQSSSQRVGASSLIPPCLGISGHPSGSRQGHPRYTGARSAGRPWVTRTQFSTAVQCRNTANMVAELESIQGKKKSLLCYEGLGDEEVHEVIHESFDEKECYDNGCKPLMLIMRVFEVVDEKRENGAQNQEESVKDEARSTKERVSTTSENNVDNTNVKSLSISTCSPMQRC